MTRAGPTPPAAGLPSLSRRAAWLRVVGYVGCYVAIIVLTMLASLVAATPWHHGSLTAKEFTSNYNHLLTYASAPDSPGEKLGADGKWYRPIPMPLYSTRAWSLPPSVLLKKTASSPRSPSPLSPLRKLFCTSPPPPTPCAPFTPCWGSGSCCPGKELSALDQELLETVAGERTWNIDGWDITCQMDFSGYEVYEQYLFPIDGETQNLTYVFSIQASQAQA